ISEYTGVYEIATHQGHLPSVRDRVGGTEASTCQIIRVGLGIGKLRRRDGAATIAKLAGGRNLSSAFRAIQREQGTAATAELGTLPILESAYGTPHTSSPVSQTVGGFSVF